VLNKQEEKLNKSIIKSISLLRNGLKQNDYSSKSKSFTLFIYPNVYIHVL